MKLPKRIQEIQPFLVMDILERAHQLEAAGQDVIHLEVGEPDFATPAPAVRAAREAMENGQTHYTTALGTLELREAIADFYNDRYGLAIGASRVAVTTGSSAAMLALFAVLLEAGDEVLLTDPHYACYPSFILSAGARPVLESDRHYVQITVSDAGSGIPENLRERVLEPLFTTKSGGTGRGLGLSMANGFVQQSRGALSVDSEPGRGTRVTLHFPPAD